MQCPQHNENAENHIYITLIDLERIHHLLKVHLQTDLTLFDVLKDLADWSSCDSSEHKDHQCHVKILAGGRKIPKKSELEAEELSLIENVDPSSRLACHITMNIGMNALIVSL